MALSKQDLWKTTNPADRDHYDDCCVMQNPHWEHPRCTCEELDEQAKSDYYDAQEARGNEERWGT